MPKSFRDLPEGDEDAGQEWLGVRLGELEEAEPEELEDLEEPEPGSLNGFLAWYYDPFEGSPGFKFTTLDDAEGVLAEIVTGDREGKWHLADLVIAVVELFGKYGSYKRLASTAFYTARRLKQFEVLGRTFGPKYRFPDQPLLLYETALKAEDPIEALEKALDEEWSPRELKDWIGGEKGETVSRVKLFSGEAPLIARGETWRIAVEAGRDWPEGDGAYTCHVVVKQIIPVESATEGEGGN